MKCGFVTANTIMKKKTTDLFTGTGQEHSARFTCFRWTQVTLSGLTREGKLQILRKPMGTQARERALTEIVKPGSPHWSLTKGLI